MSDPAVTDAPLRDGVAAGAMLRDARERAGVHIAALAVSLKVPVHKLDALESGRLDLLPDIAFARALALSICRTLKLEPAPVLERLPELASPRLAGVGTARPSASSGGTGFGAGGPALSRPVLYLGTALLLAASIIFFLPQLQTGLAQARQALATASESGAESRATGAEVNGGAERVAQSIALPVQVPSSALAGRVESSLPGTSVALPSRETTKAAVDPTNEPVWFRAGSPSWVKVTDAKGAVVLQKLLETGESVGATGSFPLSVVVGSAASTEVRIRGRAYDTQPVARDNVARFEVR